MFRSASPNFILISSIISGFMACQSPEPTSEPVADAPAAETMGLPAPPAGFDDVPAPADNPTTLEKVNLGRQLFLGKAGCGNCHSGVLFTDLLYHNVGIGMDAEEPDRGRAAVTDEESHTGAFKTPSLRDVSRSAPYFHNGSVATLEDAVDLMLGGGIQNPYLDTENLKPIELTSEERADLIEFLKALDCQCDLTAPELPE